MTKTTNYEISKKLLEIGFKAKAEKCWAKIRHSISSEFNLVNLDFAVPQNCDEWVLSYDLETLLDALPPKVGSYGYFLMGIRKENPLMPFAIGYNLADDENYGMLYCDKLQDESLADVAGRLLIILHEKNLIKF